MGVHSRYDIHVQRSDYASRVVELWAEIDGIPALKESGAADRPSISQVARPVGGIQKRPISTDRKLVYITELQAVGLVPGGTRPLIFAAVVVLLTIGAGVV